MTEKELYNQLEEYDKEVNKLFQENKKLQQRISELKDLIVLLYYLTPLNDEQQALLDEILKGEEND